MSSNTQELLKRGGFSYEWHDDMRTDIANALADDDGCWSDMRATLDRIRRGSCRSDDWLAPLDRKHADIGEVKRRIGKRLYRLYVHAPRSRPGVLYLLHFAWKPAGKSGLAVQDEQIDVAFRRLMEMPTT